MLIIGSRVVVRDGSGALAVRLFNMGPMQKVGKGAVIGHGHYAKGSVIKHETHKKVTLGEKVQVMILAVKKKVHRQNGCYVSFGKNKAMLITDKEKRRPIVNRMKPDIAAREVMRDKKNANFMKLVVNNL
jgi:ribosomal protein L14